jgi:hypothetical protein
MSGGGLLQLASYSNNMDFIFNNDADIDFFKIIYRRHTNFYMNTFVLYDDDITVDNKTVINYVIPNNGDLLSNTYIQLDLQDHYYELLKPVENYKTSLNTNILNYYDNYYITEYAKKDIIDIKIFKVNISNYLTIQATSQQDNKFINEVKTNTTILLEKNDHYYNLDLIYFFYSFITNILPEDLVNTNYLQTLFESINYEILTFLQIDLPNLNTSIKLTASPTVYQNIINEFLLNQQTTNNDRFQINKYYLYIYTTNTDVLNYIYYDNKINYTYYDNQIISKNLVIDKDILIPKLFLPNTSQFNYHIINSSSITTYNNEKLYMGNLNNNDFNQSIIQKQNELINLFNLNKESTTTSNISSTTTLSLNTYLKLMILLVCKDSININKYLDIVNAFPPPYFNNDNINIFYKNILSVVNEVLNSQSLVYQYEIQITDINTFIDKKISKYDDIITEKYLLKSVFNVNSVQNFANNIQNILLNNILYDNNENNLNLIMNYENNNNLFQLNEYSDIFLDKTAYYYQFFYDFNKLVLDNLSITGYLFNSEIYYNQTLNNKIETTTTDIYNKYMDELTLLTKTIQNNTIDKTTYLELTKTISVVLYQPIVDYYSKIKIYCENLPYNNMNDYLNYINTNSPSLSIYGINYDEQIQTDIFDTINEQLYNNQFSKQVVFTIGSPLYKLYYLFDYLCIMTNDTELINEMPKDLTTLRNQIVDYLLAYLSLSNQFKNNFIVNEEIKINSNINDNLNIYTSFYYIKNILANIYEIQIDNIFNFNDQIINKFKEYILTQKNSFVNFNDVNNLINKYLISNYNFEELILNFDTIILDPKQYTDFNTVVYNQQQFYDNINYKNSYLTNYTMGVLFTNTNRTNIISINNIFNNINYLNTLPNSYIYSIQTLDVKQYQNFLTIDNIINVFNNIQPLFYDLTASTYLDTFDNYYKLIDDIQKYIEENFDYLNKYLVDDKTFINTYNILKKPNNNIQNKFIVVLFEILDYFKKIEVDIQNFIRSKYIQFGEYLNSKYGSNIYLNVIVELKVLYSEATITLDYSNYYTIDSLEITKQFNHLFQKSYENYYYQFIDFIYTIINNTQYGLSNTINSTKLLIYSDTIKILKIISEQLIQISYTKPIDENLINVITNFSTYYPDIYYINHQNIELSIQNMLKLSIKNVPNTDLITYTTEYLNYNILKSINLEKEINRILYYYTTEYAKTLYGDGLTEFLKLNTLYDIVRMYDNIGYTEKMNITSTINAFEMLNFDLYNDTLNFTQNKYIIELMNSVDFYNEYLLFYDSCIQFDENMFASLTIDNTNAGLYFIDHPDELNEYVFKILNSEEYFSPYNVFKKTLYFEDSVNEIDVKIGITNITLKIVIYLFIVFVITKNIPQYIIKTLGIKYNNQLEYLFPKNTILFKIADALNDSIAYDLNKFISDFYTNQLLLPSSYEKPYNDPYIIQICNNNLQLDNTYNFYIFCESYILSYQKTIQTELISNINNIFINEELNNYSIDILQLTYNNEFTDINGINYTKIESKKINNLELYYSKSGLNQMNLYYTLSIELLKYYDVDFNVNPILNNYITTSAYYTDELEKMKGVTKNEDILKDIMNEEVSLELTRSNNIEKLTNMNSLTLITPIDYNYDYVFGTLNKSNIQSTYYDTSYNYYNYLDNESAIYNTKYQYYTKLLENPNNLKNIKKTNTELYRKLFMDIIYTIIENSTDYNIAFKEILELHMIYNFLYRINTNTSTYNNLLTQDILNNELKNSTTLDDFNTFITHLYYYELFGINVIEGTKTSSNYDIIELFNVLNQKDNYFFEYEYIYFNYSNKFNQIITITNNDVLTYLNIQAIKNKYYEKFINTINLNYLLTLFRLSTENLLKYDTNLSINYQLNFVYTNYFKGKIFKTTNNISYTLTLKEFEYYIYEYILYLIKGENYFIGITTNKQNMIEINETLNEKIEFINSYYILANNKKITTEEIKFKNSYLTILYRIKILLLTCKNQENYLVNLNKTLLNCNQYILNGIEFDCLTLNNSINFYFDFLNSNGILINQIDDYYKTISNTTIKNNKQLNYKYTNLLITKTYEKLKYYNTENEITLNLFPNVLGTILYKFEELYYKDTKKIINVLVDDVNLSIKSKMNNIGGVFGGYSTLGSSYPITIQQIKSIYTENVYSLNDNFINMFSVIYSNYNFSSESLNYNFVVVIFYNTLLLTFLFNEGEKYEKLDINSLVNLINKSILNKDTIFFDKLDTILINQVNNDVFVQETIDLFNIVLMKENNNVKVSKQTYNFQLKSYDSPRTVIYNHLYNFNSRLEYEFIPNSKINIWMQSLQKIVDINQSSIIDDFKSINSNEPIRIQEMYMNYLYNRNSIITQYGIIDLVSVINLYIGDQIIDSLNRNFYKIAFEIMTDSNKVRTLREMYGMDDNNVVITQTPFIVKLCKRQYLIPLYFFFKDRMNSLILIACIYPQIRIELKVNNTTLINSVYYNKIIDTYNNTLFKTSLSLDYIILEQNERKIITSQITENIIEKHRTFVLNKNLLEFDRSVNTNFFQLNFEIDLNNSVKEIFWTVDFYLNDYLIDFDSLIGENELDNIILSTTLSFDSIYRDGIYPNSFIDLKTPPTQDSDIQYLSYNSLFKYITTYKYNTRSNPNCKYYAYSFGFKPEILQPTGAMNMSTINRFGIDLIMDRYKIIKYIGNENLKKIGVRLTLYTLEYNILRYMSSMGHLLFVK